MLAIGAAPLLLASLLLRQTGPAAAHSWQYRLRSIVPSLAAGLSVLRRLAPTSLSLPPSPLLFAPLLFLPALAEQHHLAL